MTENERFEEVCLRIEKGQPLKFIFESENSPMSNTLFYRLLRENKELNERYARAREIYAASIFDEIIEIADESHSDVEIGEDGKVFTNNEVVQRSRLKIDARKWVLSKLEPKKYGDKLEIDGNLNQKITQILSIDPLSDVETDNGTS
jgi:hypothetical protein